MKKKSIIGSCVFTLPISLLITSTFALSLKAEIKELTSDDRLLEQKILEYSRDIPVREKNYQIQFNNSLKLNQTLSSIQWLQKNAEAKFPSCKNSRKKIVANKYLMTFDESGKACRIYDLSFPTLKSLLKIRKVTQIPVRNIASKDFLNWIDGNNQALQTSQEQFKNQFDAKAVAKNSWISKLRFKKKPTSVPGSQSSENDLGLPSSFSLADLDVGDFQFDQSTIQQSAEYMSDLKNSQIMQDGFSSPDENSENLLKTFSAPQKILQSVKLNWNDLDKVYDVIIDGEFLPLGGPVALIDFQQQYKYTVEKMLRSVLSAALVQLSRAIPQTFVSNVIEVLITDAFEQMNMLYEYQLNQLEDTLRTLKKNGDETAMSLTVNEQALNILYGQSTNLLSNYLMSAIQQKQFDWEAFDKIGKSARYSVEKQRDILMSKTNSRLVLEKKCEIEFFQDYFAICSKGGKKEALYSLISEQNLKVMNLGAPVIHRYAKPYETALIRGGTWILSLAARIIGIPLNRTLTMQLDSLLKNFMYAGLTDEGYLKNNLSSLQKENHASKEQMQMLNWLYIQNLNPFLPKSMNAENSIIDSNKQLLGLTEL